MPWTKLKSYKYLLTKPLNSKKKKRWLKNISVDEYKTLIKLINKNKFFEGIEVDE